MKTTELRDSARARVFPVDIWSPLGSDQGELVIYSHFSGGHRRAAAFVCTHHASHGSRSRPWITKKTIESRRSWRWAPAAMSIRDLASCRSKRMFILRRADHQHFLEDVEGAHEVVRNAQFPPEAAWIRAAMVPITELSAGEQAHDFVRSLTLAHLDATMRGMKPAQEFLDGDVPAELALHGADAMPPSPSTSSPR